MTYTPKYVNFTSLSLKAANRLRILDDNEDNLFTSTSVATQAVPEDLLLLVIEEEEAFLDGYLQYVYVLPLVNQHPILAKCVEGLVLSKLYEYLFPYTGADTNTNQQNSLRMESLQIIRALTYNINVYIPFPGNQGGNALDGFHINPLILPGETFQLTDINDTIPLYRGVITGTKTKVRKEWQKFNEGNVESFNIEPRFRRSPRDLRDYNSKEGQFLNTGVISDVDDNIYDF